MSMSNLLSAIMEFIDAPKQLDQCGYIIYARNPLAKLDQFIHQEVLPSLNPSGYPSLHCTIWDKRVKTLKRLERKEHIERRNFRTIYLTANSGVLLKMRNLKWYIFLSAQCSLRFTFYMFFLMVFWALILEAYYIA